MTLTGILIGFLLTVHVIVSILLVLMVLMQRPKSEGLGTAFGGGVTDSLFGSSAGNVLTKITTWLGIIFFVTTVSLAYLYSHRDTKEQGLANKLKAIATTPTNQTATASVISTNTPSTPATSPANSSPVADSKTQPTPASTAKPAPAPAPDKAKH